jgi:uncharacterized protein YjbI with pentapeptide repeats
VYDSRALRLTIYTMEPDPPDPNIRMMKFLSQLLRSEPKEYCITLQGVPTKLSKGLNLDSYDFSHTSLANADFEQVSLLQANFTQADLKESTFTDADVRGASYFGANLQSALFISTKVEDADFTNANLTNTIWVPLDRVLPPEGWEVHEATNSLRMTPDHIDSIASTTGCDPELAITLHEEHLTLSPADLRSLLISTVRANTQQP